jgi:uncharacterized protein DUF1579
LAILVIVVGMQQHQENVMNRKSLAAVAASALLGGTAVYTVTAQEYGGNNEIEIDAMTQAWLDAGIPGPEHAEMAKGVGTFAAHGTMYMPDGSTSNWKGTVKRKAIFDGRYIVEHYKVDDMPGFGSFEGHGILGFNNLTEKYEGVWVDSLSTMIFTSKGEMDPSTGNIVMYGKRMDPVTKKNMKSKSVVSFGDDGSYTVDMYIVSPEGEFKEMSIHHMPMKDKDHMPMMDKRDHKERSDH